MVVTVAIVVVVVVVVVVIVVVVVVVVSKVNISFIGINSFLQKFFTFLFTEIAKATSIKLEHLYNKYITISVTTTIFYKSKFDTDAWQTQEKFTIMDL